MPPAVIFIESNTSGTGRLFVEAARALGYRPVLITARPAKYAYLTEDGAPEVVVLPQVDEDRVDEVIRCERRAGPGVAGITSSSEYFVGMAAALAERHGLPGANPARVKAARDKGHQRAVLSAAGLPTPEFRVVTSASDAAAAAGATGLPVVVKPIDGSGSVGVRACVTEAEVNGHAAALLRRDGRPEARRLLVERLIDGPEFSVEVFSGRVMGITRKHLGPRPHFVETGHDYPAVPGAHTPSLIDTVTRATALLGLQWGPLHWELRMQGATAYPIEVNPRLAGGFIPELIRQAEGIDVIRQTLRLVVGQPVHIEPRHHRHASIRFLLAPAPGRLSALDGIEQARAVPGVSEIAMYRAMGETVTIEGDFRDRVGHVIACAEASTDASDAAERGRDRIRLRVEQLGPRVGVA